MAIHDSAEEHRPPRVDLDGRRVVFHVIERLRGQAPGVVHVTTGHGGGDCGYAFSIGDAYLVYARGEGDRLSTSICSRTRPLAGAHKDLAYLRTLRGSRATAGVLQGTVVRRPDGAAGRSVPLVGAPIVASDSAGRRYVTRTATGGKYELRVPAGTYFVVAELPSGPIAGNYLELVELRDPRGCATWNITIE